MSLFWKIKELIYDPTIRRIGPLHRLVRFLAWQMGEGILAVGELMTKFKVYHDPKLPPYYRLDWLIGGYEREIIKLYSKILRPGMKVVDIGAHIGYHTVRFAELVGPTGTVFAFEPSPLNFGVLCGNVRRRALSNVVLEQKAVSDIDDEVTLYFGRHDGRHSIVRRGEESCKVNSISLDSYFGERETVQFVKIDVEGAELKVLRGMKNLIARSPDITLILEFCPGLLCLSEGDRGPMELLNWLLNQGFYLYEIGKKSLVPLKAEEGSLEIFISSVFGHTNLLAIRRPWG